MRNMLGRRNNRCWEVVLKKTFALIAMVVELITNKMKKYNVKNYIRYKEDVKGNQPEGKFYDEYTRDELIVKFLPLVENIARKFATSQEAFIYNGFNTRR